MILIITASVISSSVADSITRKQPPHGESLLQLAMIGNHVMLESEVAPTVHTADRGVYQAASHPMAMSNMHNVDAEAKSDPDQTLHLIQAAMCTHVYGGH